MLVVGPYVVQHFVLNEDSLSLKWNKRIEHCNEKGIDDRTVVVQHRYATTEQQWPK